VCALFSSLSPAALALVDASAPELIGKAGAEGGRAVACCYYCPVLCVCHVGAGKMERLRTVYRVMYAGAEGGMLRAVVHEEARDVACC
jgi:hypothetical protein